MEGPAGISLISEMAHMNADSIERYYMREAANCSAIGKFTGERILPLLSLREHASAASAERVGKQGHCVVGGRTL